MKAGDCMGMTDSQFKGFIRFVLDDIKEVLENMADGKEKEKLQKVADNLQQTLEDWHVIYSAIWQKRNEVNERVKDVEQIIFPLFYLSKGTNFDTK